MLIVGVKIFKEDIASSRKEVVVCLGLFFCQNCKSEFISLMSDTFNLTINYVESSIREDEDVTFNIP